MTTNLGCFDANLPKSHLRPLMEEGSPGSQHLGHCCWLCFLHSIIPLYRIHNSKAYSTENYSVISPVLSGPCGELGAIWSGRKAPMSCRVVLGPTERLRLAAVRIQVYWPFLAAGTPRHALLSRDLSLSWLQTLAESLFPLYFLCRSLSAHPGTVRV